MTRECKDCKKELSLSEFYISERKNGRTYRPRACKKCINKKARDNYDPKKKKSDHLKYLYGITLQEYNSKLERQNGGCAICGIKIPGGKGTHFYVDHNHTTGQVRDLLCHNCNFILGYAKENKDILNAVIQYLDIWGGQS